jgi:hypothetical protein
MAHFAELNENNVVVNVYCCDNSWDGLEDSLSAQTGLNLKQTSYNTIQGIHYGPDQKPDGGTPYRGNYAGVGFTYRSDIDGFIPPEPDNGFFNAATFSWEANWVALPNGAYWLMLYKNASSSISSAILTQLFNNPTEGFSNPNRRSLPMVGVPDGPAYAVIRDPIDRFLSAYNMGIAATKDMDLSQVVDWVVSQDPRMVDLHFRPQATVIGDVSEVTFFDFAKDLSPLAAALGLGSLPTLHVSDKTKPDLSSDDTAKLQAYYAGDIALYTQAQSSQS